MKNLIVIALLVIATRTDAQIRLEHTYTSTPSFTIPRYGAPVQLVQVDSNEWKYVAFNRKDTIMVFNLDHSFDRIIVLPPNGQSFGDIQVLARNLFAADSSLACAVSYQSNLHSFVIYKEDGQILFSCDTCQLGDAAYEQRIGNGNFVTTQIRNTPSGTKMLINYPTHPFAARVYSLPGRLFGSARGKAGVSQPAQYAIDEIPSNAYPNPSSGNVLIAYELPAGVGSAVVSIQNEAGQILHRYRVTKNFSTLIINGNEFASGTYFYQVTTERGSSEAKRLVITH